MRRRAWIAAGALAAATGALPAGAGTRVPVLCSVIVTAGTTGTFACMRQDTRTSFASVPRGAWLHVTDVLVDRNSLATTGVLRTTIGRESGSILPGDPVISASGTPLESVFLAFGSPPIVLDQGEALAAHNDATTAFPINVFASGYLSDTVLLPEPSADALLLSGAGALAMLASRRNRSRWTSSHDR